MIALKNSKWVFFAWRIFHVSNRFSLLIKACFPDHRFRYGTIHIWRPWKLSNFQDAPPPCPATSKILLPPWPWTSIFKWTPPLQMKTNQLNENIIQGWLLYVIGSFLQVGFRFHYQLINLVWFSIDFSSFSWIQPRSQGNLKKLKTSFSPSSYSEKMCWGEGWAEASLSAFSWLYILVCAVVQKYHKMFFVYNCSHFSTHFAINLFYLRNLKT